MTVSVLMHQWKKNNLQASLCPKDEPRLVWNVDNKLSNRRFSIRCHESSLQNLSKPYPKVFTGSLISSLSSTCQLLLLQQGHSITLCGSKFYLCSFWGAINRSEGFEGVSTKLPVQFARALREAKSSACSDHSLQEGKTISSAKLRGYLTSPPTKTSPSV